MLRLMALLRGCWLPIRSLRSNRSSRAGWIRGRYELRPEVSAFRPEGSAERWWTSFSETITEQAGQLMESARGTGVDVELSGDVSEPGEYGHMRMYARTFLVRAIRNIDQPGAGSRDAGAVADATAGGLVPKGGGEPGLTGEHRGVPSTTHAYRRPETRDAARHSRWPSTFLLNRWRRAL